MVKMRETPVFLSYLERKQLEALIQENWNGKKYVKGVDDTEIANRLSKQLGKTVKPTHASGLRRELGLKLNRSNKVKMKYLTYDHAADIDELLKEHRMVVVTRSEKGIQIGTVGE